MNKMIYQHFSKNDSSFIDKGVEWIKKVEDSYSPFLTPFVNPHQEKILKVLASTNGISYMSSRQFLETEYVRVLLYPCLLYTSPSPRDGLLSRMPSSA